MSKVYELLKMWEFEIIVEMHWDFIKYLVQSKMILFFSSHHIIYRYFQIP
jgi:hypothetical protein